MVGGLSLAAYGEARASAIRLATERLERMGRELATSAAQSAATRVASLRRLAADGAIRGAMESRTPAVVESRFDEARPPSDSTLVAWQIASVAGGPRYASRAGWSAVDSAALAPAVAEAVRSATNGRSILYAVGDPVHSWTVVPVLAGDRVVGTVAELRRVADNRAGEAAIRSLLDDDARVLFTSRGSRIWVTLRGRPIAAPFALPAVESRAASVHIADTSAFAVQQAVPLTPWVIVVLQPEASMLRRPHEFLRKLLGAGAVILALATIGAWLLSRHLTRPLRRVTEAAAALADGDYGRRVRVSDGGREVARLSATFNAMAGAIGDAHAALADRNMELQRANSAKEQFLAVMSHELRTPLNAIGGFTELIELGLRGPVTPEQVEDLGRIRRNKDLLLSIITDILNFVRTDAGAIVVKREPVPIAPVLADVVDIVGHQFEAKGVRLVAAPVPSDAIVRGDCERVQQVLLNLLSNAMKFTEPGGEVAIETSVADHRVRVDVRNTGSGIAAGHLDEIFEPFVQVDASLTRTAGGAGLGLAIARQLATAMGGTLVVRSTVGAGSTFTLTLPHVDLPVPALDAPALLHSRPAGQIA